MRNIMSHNKRLLVATALGIGLLFAVVNTCYADETGNAKKGGKDDLGTAIDTPGFLPGAVLVYPPRYDINGNRTGPPKVLSPDGRYVDISNTQTDGLQEAIDYMAEHNYDLHIFGGNMPVARNYKGERHSGSAGAVVYFCRNTIIFPPMQGKKISSGAITINIDVPRPLEPGVVIDSCMMVDVNLAGAQIVYHGSGATLEFRPTRPVPLDMITVITDSNFKITTVVNPNRTPAITSSSVLFNAENGPILNNSFNFDEVNGSYNGIKVINGSFISNYIKSMHIHRFDKSGAGVQIGVTSDAKNGKANTWQLGISNVEGGGGTGIDTFGSGDIFILNGFMGIKKAIRLQNSAVKNKIIIGGAQEFDIENLSSKPESNKII